MWLWLQKCSQRERISNGAEVAKWRPEVFYLAQLNPMTTDANSSHREKPFFNHKKRTNAIYMGRFRVRSQSSFSALSLVGGCHWHCELCDSQAWLSRNFPPFPLQRAVHSVHLVHPVPTNQRPFGWNSASAQAKIIVKSMQSIAC